jgi:aarF domain-containing kinase
MFVHGFIHCDPHPGNILVGLDKNQQLQLTLLDHGLYMKIDDQFRMNYCRLWRSLILGDVEGIKLYAASMNAGHAYHLFAGMLTYKTWDTVTDPTRTTDLDRLKIVARKDPDQFDHVQADPVLQEYASRYATEIADILNRLPRAMLLMFKTNDCLRSVDIALGNPVSNHLIMAQACLRVIVADRLRGASNVWQKMRIVWEEFPVWLRLAAFDWLSWYASKSTTRVSAHTIPL